MPETTAKTIEWTIVMEAHDAFNEEIRKRGGTARPIEVASAAQVAAQAAAQAAYEAMMANGQMSGPGAGYPIPGSVPFPVRQLPNNPLLAPSSGVRERPVPVPVSDQAAQVLKWQRFFAGRPELKYLAHDQTAQSHAMLRREFDKWEKAM